MYFSDKENFNKEQKLVETISVNAWNGIAVIVNTLIQNNNLAKDYPRHCPDGNGVCGVDEHSFYIGARSIIPTIDFLPEYGNIDTLSSSYLEPNPFENGNNSFQKSEQFKYEVLDFIEFVFKHICDVQNGDYHDFFHHYEIKFLDTTLARDKFISDINEIFERNHIAFKLCPNGEIQRILDENLCDLIDSCAEPHEDTLRDMLQTATTKISSAKFEERKVAMERLWDAFERIKTVLNPDNKRHSANELLDRVSKGNVHLKKILEDESKSLTNIGNSFQIRHYECSTVPIKESRHLDYLFFRMLSFIQLLLTEL